MQIRLLKEWNGNKAESIIDVHSSAILNSLIDSGVAELPDDLKEQKKQHNKHKMEHKTKGHDSK